MSKTLDQVRELVLQGRVRVSQHGYDELAADGILAREAIQGLANAIIVEDYPDYPKGPCILVREIDNKQRGIHVLREYQEARQNQPY